MTQDVAGRVPDARKPARRALAGRASASGAQEWRGGEGITTAEYAVGTAAGAALAGVLYTLVTSGFGDKLLTTLFDHVLSLIGVG